MVNQREKRDSFLDAKESGAVTMVVNSLLNFGAYHATRYLSTRRIVRATRTLADKSPKYAKRVLKGGNVCITLTIGKPNHLERKFIKDCVAAKEPFPIKGVILKYPPERRVKIIKKKR